MILQGKVWKVGDNISSDHFISPKYDSMGRKGQYAELALHILEDKDPNFIEKVQRGDLIVAGRSFGSGKHLGSLIGAFKELGIEGVIAKSFSAAWERASINAGLPALLDKGIQLMVETGDVLRIDLASHEACNVTQGSTVKISPVSTVIYQILQAGGLEPFTLLRLARESGSQS